MIAVLAVGIVLWLGLIVSMRTKFSPALTAIRRMNRRFANPRVLRTAGTADSGRAVIRHTGRSTGRIYRTPIAVEDTGDGFVIALPYGTSPDWLQNVLAAGTAVVVANGRSYEVGEPRVVGHAEVDHRFSGGQRRIHRLYGVDQFLVLARVDAGVPAVDHG